MKRLGILVCVLLSFAAAALAHQPRLIRDKPSVEVQNPEISQAFYAWLNGSAQSYYIRSETPFRLYVNLLVPDLPGIGKDYTAVIYKKEASGEQALGKLEGQGFDWRPFFEPFGGDRYLLGPEWDRSVEAGTYIVVVTNPGLRGKYALAVGKKEKFPPGEWIRTARVLPQLKREFFEKSPLKAYFNLTGVVFLLIAAGAIALGKLIF